MPHHNLDDCLLRLSRLLRLVGLGRHLLLWLIATALLLAALCLAAHLCPTPLLLPLALLLSLAGFTACLALALLRPLRARRVALAVEQHHPDLQELLSTAVALKAGPPAPFSPQLSAALVLDAELALRRIPPRSLLDLHRLRPLLVAGLLSLLLAAASLLVSRDALAMMLQEPPELPALVQRLLPAPDPSPLVSGLRLVITPPEYTALPPRTVTSRLALLQAPVGSTIALSAARPAVGSLSLALNDQHNPLRALEGARLGRQFTLTADIRWQLENAHGSQHHRLAGRLRALPDHPPTVRLTHPDKDLILKELRPLKLLGRASDDYGLRDLVLEYRIRNRHGWRQQSLGATGQVYLLDTEWDLSPLGLQPGDTVEYRLRATDDNRYSGPGHGTSRLHRLTLASLPPEQAAERVEQARSEQEEGLQRLRERAANLQSELAALQEKLQQGQELSEAERAQLQQAADQLQKQGDELRQTAARAAQDLQRDGVSPELARRLSEVHKLLNETLDKQLRETIQKLQQAARQKDGEQAQQSLQEAEEAHRQLLERLDQLLALMKQAKLEGDLAALRQELEKLAGRQQELINKREQGARLADQARPQQALARDTAETVRQTAQLAEQTAQENAKLGQRLQATAETLAQADPAAQMQQASQALQASQSQQAAGPQQQALQALREAAAQLSAAQADVYADLRQELSQAAARLVRQALELSERQEYLRADVTPYQHRGPEQMMQQKAQIQRLAARQQALTRGSESLARQLAELAGKSPLVEPALALQAAGIAGHSAQAEREVAGGDMPSAHDTQQQVMSALNQLAQALLGAEQQFRQASAQMAMQEYLKRLEQLARQQAALNQMTQQQGGGMPVPMPGGQQGQMPGASQLGGQQAAIREALQKMLGQAGQQSGLGQQLGGVPAEMNEVEKDLRSHNLGRQTYRRQEQILHKMLDAQRSLYQRDREERQRLAEPPRPYQRPTSPPALRPSPRTAARWTGPQTPPQDLPLGYEDLTRAYLRALTRAR